MRAITKEQYHREAEPLLRQIFVTDEMPEDRVFDQTLPDEFLSITAIAMSTLRR